MQISKHFDWISITFPEGTKASDVLPMLDWRYQGEGRNGYMRYERDGLTGAGFSSLGRPEMGSHLQLPGQALSVLRMNWNMTDAELIAHLSRKQGKVSRLDVAINLHGATLKPMALVRAYRRKEIKSRARKWLYVHGGQDGIDAMTFYLGNRESERYLRAYDKNAEQKIVNAQAWTRLEIELKHLRAQGAQNACKAYSVDAVINAQFDDFLSWQNREYQLALAGDSAGIQEIGRKDTNTERWLLSAVAKSLAKQVHLDPAFRSRFDKQVDHELSELQAQEPIA